MRRRIELSRGRTEFAAWGHPRLLAEDRLNSTLASRPARPGIEPVAAGDDLVPGLGRGVNPGDILHRGAVGLRRVDPVAGALVRASVGALGDLQNILIDRRGLEIPVSL